MVDDASVRMMAEETGAPEWVCRLALEASPEDAAPEDPIAEEILRVHSIPVAPSKPSR